MARKSLNITRLLRKQWKLIAALLLLAFLLWSTSRKFNLFEGNEHEGESPVIPPVPVELEHTHKGLAWNLPDGKRIPIEHTHKLAGKNAKEWKYDENIIGKPHQHKVFLNKSGVLNSMIKFSPWQETKKEKIIKKKSQTSSASMNESPSST